MKNIYLLIIDRGSKEVYGFASRDEAVEEGKSYQKDSGYSFTVVSVPITKALERMFYLG